MLDRVKEWVCGLEVLLDSGLLLKVQVAVLVHQLWPSLESSNLATVIHALITCCWLFHLLQCSVLTTHEKMLRKYKIQQGCCVILLLHELQWLPIYFQAQSEMFIRTLKAQNILGPGLLKDCLLPYVPLTHSGHSMRPHSTCPCLSRHSRDFSVVSLILWNALPRRPV